MSARVSVGSTYWDKVFWIALGVGAAGVALSVSLWVTKWEFTYVSFWLVVALVPLAMAGVRLGQLISRRFWLEETPTGFRLTTWRATHDLTADDVLELGTHLRDVRPGENTDDPLERMMRLPRTHRQRVVTMRLAPPSIRKPVKLIYRWPIGTEDPFAGLFARLSDGMAERASQTVRDGGRLEGRGWVLTPSALTIDENEFEVVRPESVNGRVRRTIPLAHMLAVRAADNALVVEVRTTGEPVEWQFGPVRGANGGVLQRALARLVADIRAGTYSPPGTAEELPVDEGSPLGRLIYASSLSFDQDQLRVYTGGVACHNLKGVTEIPDAELLEFSCVCVRSVTLLAGETVGYTVSMTFTGTGNRTVKHSEYTATDDNPEMDGIRDDVSRRMAAVMERRLADGRSVRWTDRVTFEPDGVSVAVSKNADDDVLIDWDDVLLVNTKPGRFALTSRRTGRTVKTLPSSADNFFPGFFLLEDRRKAREQQRQRDDAE